MTVRLQKDAFAERERALEEEFFHRSNKELLEQLRESLAEQAIHEALAAATGIDDPALLDELVANEVRPESVAALTLAPLVLVAWADGGVDQHERKNVLNAADEKGLDEIALRLLENWMAMEPSSQLLQTWKRFTHAACQSMSAAARDILRDDILRRAKAVAKASGGVLGFGRVTRDEQKLLDEVRQAFVE